MTELKAKWRRVALPLPVSTHPWHWHAQVGLFVLTADPSDGLARVYEATAPADGGPGWRIDGPPLYEKRIPTPCDHVTLMAMAEAELARRLGLTASTMDGSHIHRDPPPSAAPGIEVPPPAPLVTPRGVGLQIDDRPRQPPDADESGLTRAATLALINTPQSERDSNWLSLSQRNLAMFEKKFANQLIPHEAWKHAEALNRAVRDHRLHAAALAREALLGDPARQPDIFQQAAAALAARGQDVVRCPDCDNAFAFSMQEAEQAALCQCQCGQRFEVRHGRLVAAF